MIRWGGVVAYAQVRSDHGVLEVKDLKAYLTISSDGAGVKAIRANY